MSQNEFNKKLHEEQMLLFTHAKTEHAIITPLAIYQPNLWITKWSSNHFTQTIIHQTGETNGS